VEVDPARAPAVGQEEVEEGIHRRPALPRSDLGQREPRVVRARRGFADAGEVPAVEAHRDPGFRHPLEEVVAEPRAAGQIPDPAEERGEPALVHPGRQVVAQPAARGVVRVLVAGDPDPPPAGLADQREQVGGAAPAVELARMAALVEEAMAAGAFGLSTGLFGPPSGYAATDEVVALARVAARYGGGYHTHMRDEGVRIAEAVREALEIGERAGCAVQISHLPPRP
jgi:hypothetical protein